MSQSRVRSPRRVMRGGVAALLALAFLAGCTGQQEPDSYTDSVEENFLEQCVLVSKADGISRDATTYCQCVYAAITDKNTGIKFSEFKKVNDDLRDNAQPLPASFTKLYDACKL